MRKVGFRLFLLPPLLLVASGIAWGGADGSCAKLPGLCDSFLQTKRTRLAAVWSGFQTEGRPIRTAFSPDGTFVLLASFCPEGADLSAGENNLFTLWDARTGREVA